MISPIRCTLPARTDSATIRANPAFDVSRMRSKPRCSKLLIADSTPGCRCLASRNLSSLSRCLSALDNRPLVGSAKFVRFAFRAFRPAELQNPLSKLHPSRSGNSSCASSMILGTRST